MTISTRVRAVARRWRRGGVVGAPASFPFVSGDTFRSMADVVVESPQDVANLSRQLPREESALLFSSVDAVPALAAWVAGHDVTRHVLIIHNGDAMHTWEIRFLADCFHHVFAVNWLESHPSVTPIPIGLENARLDHNGRLDLFVDGLPASQATMRQRPRDIPVLCAFAVGTNPVIRQAALDTFGPAPGTLAPTGRLTPRQHADLLLKTMFVISPPGNGPDCHRTWEAICLGAVPVVLASHWPFSADALPVLVADDWEQAQRMIATDGMEIHAGLSTRSRARAYFSHYARAILDRLDEAGHGRS